MSVFEYFTALLSIILGLALALVARGIGSLMVSSNRTAGMWLGAVWSIAILTNLLVYWVVIWRVFSSMGVIKFWEMLLYALSTLMLYLAAFVLTSSGEDNSPILNKGEGPGTPFFLCLGIHFLLAAGYAMVVGQFNVGQGIGVFLLALCCFGPFMRKPSHHFVLAAIYLLANVGLAVLVTDAIGEGVLKRRS